MKTFLSSLYDQFSKQLSTHRFHLLIVIVLSSLLLFSNLHKGGLSGYDDAFYAHEGKQMLYTGDWWSIHINGYQNSEYPPMFIWLEAASMTVFGISDFAAKFPSALAGLLTIILVFGIARELSDEFWLPVCAAWILMLSQYFIKYAMHAMTDVPYTLFFTLSLYFYVKGLKRPWYFVLFGVALASAILTRSVLGLIPVGIVIIHLVVIKRYPVLWSRHFVGGLIVAILLPSIWYVSQYRLHGPAFLNDHFSFIFNKVVIDKPSSDGSFLRGLLEYPWLLLRLYWPWLPLMLIGLAMQIKNAVRERDRMATLLILWVLFVIVPLSLVEAKVLRYIMPVFPAFAILSAIPLARWLPAVGKNRYVPLAYAVLCVAVLLIAVFPKPLKRAEEMSRLAPIAEAHSDQSQRVLIYTSGEARHDYITQFLWYADRFCEHLLDPDKLVERLRVSDSTVFIVDKASYERLVKNSGVTIQELGNTENFVCFRVVGERTLTESHPPIKLIVRDG